MSTATGSMHVKLLTAEYSFVIVVSCLSARLQMTFHQLYHYHMYYLHHGIRGCDVLGVVNDVRGRARCGEFPHH